MIGIPLVKQLEPYFKIAEDEAHKSPCIRRQYGAVVTYPALEESNAWFVASHNVRVSTCCGGNTCARDRVNTRHGGSVEIGGEIHAETSLLIKSQSGLSSDPDRQSRRHPESHVQYFILVGFEKGQELLGKNVYPCHSCAMAIKFAGYKRIYIRNKDKQIITVSINEVMESRIAEWEPVD